MGGRRKVSLRLPPNLEEPSRERAVAGHVVLLLPQAKERLRQLCRLEDLGPGRVVGRGGSSLVRWIERAGKPEMYATKVFNTLNREHGKLLSAELRVLLSVDCPCIIKFYGAWDDQNYVNLVLEAMWLGSLFDMIYVTQSSCFSCPPGVLRWRAGSDRAGGPLHNHRDERAILAIDFQIFWGLEYLHSMGIVHRDVKPSNILANTCGSVKLADFGTALPLAEKTNDVMGTFRYMPPENAPREKGDVWAAGLVVAELFAHDVPFKSCGTHVEMAQLLDESDNDTLITHVLPKRSPVPESITRLVQKCLNFDPDKRPSAAQMLQSDTFSNIGFSTPDHARKEVRKWLFHQDDELCREEATGQTLGGKQQRGQQHQQRQREQEGPPAAELPATEVYGKNEDDHDGVDAHTSAGVGVGPYRSGGSGSSSHGSARKQQRGTSWELGTTSPRQQHQHETVFRTLTRLFYERRSPPPHAQRRETGGSPHSLANSTTEIREQQRQRQRRLPQLNARLPRHPLPPSPSSSSSSSSSCSSASSSSSSSGSTFSFKILRLRRCSGGTEPPTPTRSPSSAGGSAGGSSYSAECDYVQEKKGDNHHHHHHHHHQQQQQQQHRQHHHQQQPQHVQALGKDHHTRGRDHCS